MKQVTTESNSSEREGVDKESTETGDSDEENYNRNYRSRHQKERDTQSDGGISYSVIKNEPLKVRMHSKEETKNLGSGFKTSNLENKVKKTRSTPNSRCKKA